MSLKLVSPPPPGLESYDALVAEAMRAAAVAQHCFVAAQAVTEASLSIDYVKHGLAEVDALETAAAKLRARLAQPNPLGEPA